MDPYAYKTVTRAYLEELNKDKKVLEYCLFQPGLFTNYLIAPYKSTKHLTAFETPFDFRHRRMLVVEGGYGSLITFTTVQDLANVVALAVEFEGVWPIVGGMTGTKMSIGELIVLGERVRGMYSFSAVCIIIYNADTPKVVSSTSPNLMSMI
jgi:hypothetical protein